jgi:type II secretory ATPase GspE/PulE/Tfp pilus assembly ATPase PilB-like protein
MNEFQLQKLLRRHAGLSEAALADLNHEAVKTGSPLEDVVLRSGLLTRERLHEYLAQELGVPYVDLTNYLIEPEMLALVPAELARKHEAMPLFRVSGILTVAMANPDDIGALDELRRALKLNINPVLADSASLREAISQHYRPENASAISEAVVEIEADDALRYIESGDKAKSIEQLAGEAPVVRFVSTIMQQAAGDRASDIHIEPEENGLRVRIRVDGLLHEVGRFPAMLQPAVTSRIKILAGMDISDRRRAQDGRFDFAYEGRQIDVRTSTFPTAYGENVVMRLLDKTGGFLKLEDLGMGSTILDRFRTLIRQPHGIILVTGPTGSGKTTTLYSALNVINSRIPLSSTSPGRGIAR